MVVSNRNLLFQGSIFRCYVSFREGIYIGQTNTYFAFGAWKSWFVLLEKYIFFINLKQNGILYLPAKPNFSAVKTTASSRRDFLLKVKHLNPLPIRLRGTFITKGCLFERHVVGVVAVGTDQPICFMKFHETESTNPKNHGGLFHAIFHSWFHGIVVWPQKKKRSKEPGLRAPYFGAAPIQVVPLSNPLKGSIKRTVVLPIGPLDTRKLHIASCLANFKQPFKHFKPTHLSSNCLIFLD